MTTKFIYSITIVTAKGQFFAFVLILCSSSLNKLSAVITVKVASYNVTCPTYEDTFKNR